jgi:hypothetical protein
MPLLDRLVDTIEHRCGLTRGRFEKTEPASASCGQVVLNLTCR